MEQWTRNFLQKPQCGWMYVTNLFSSLKSFPWRNTIIYALSALSETKSCTRPTALFNQLFICFSVRSVMHKYMEKKNEINFDKIFNQVLGKYYIWRYNWYHLAFLDTWYAPCLPKCVISLTWQQLYYDCSTLLQAMARTDRGWKIKVMNVPISSLPNCIIKLMGT